MAVSEDSQNLVPVLTLPNPPELDLTSPHDYTDVPKSQDQSLDPLISSYSHKLISSTSSNYHDLTTHSTKSWL